MKGGCECHLRTLGTELGASGRAALCLNQWGISPVCHLPQFDRQHLPLLCSRSISNTAYLPCATSWESSIPSDLTPSSGSTLHRCSACVLRALSSKLCSSRGCHSPHHVSCVSWRLSVSAYGPVCGCWAFRLHNPHGLLSSWSHLSTWLSSAGRRRV